MKNQKKNKIKNITKNVESKPYIIDGIKINERIMNQLLNKENDEKISDVIDLNQLNTKSESELLKIFEQMIKTKNYFNYSSSLLININPGPSNVENYLNLKKFISNTNNQKKRHLYSFLHYIFKLMVTENKDQVINLLGQANSGKTFNLIHILEYFTSIYSPKNYDNEIFELIHNSIQLLHIFGSVFRDNNIESTTN